MKRVDGVDISAEMLNVAQTKGVYANLYESDLTQKLPVEDGAYAGVVSAGTFTHGHVGPDALEAVLTVLRPDGRLVISVNAKHWDARGVETVLERLAPLITEDIREDIAIYDAATGDDAADRVWLLTLRRA